MDTTNPAVPTPGPSPHNSTRAVLSLLFGLMGLVPFAGVLLGPVAIVLGVKARAQIRRDPTLTGAGLANTGVVLGIVAVVFAILCLLVVAVVFYVVSGGPWRR